jgi:hypothetical protein
MALPISLPALTDREAIVDALNRFTTGLDTADAALFDSAFFSDARFEMNGQALDGLDVIHERLYNLVSKLDTTHFITNVRANVEAGSSKASMTATALAKHYRSGQGQTPNAHCFSAGSRYTVDCMKEENGSFWKIKHFKGESVWFEGDRAAVIGQ